MMGFSVVLAASAAIWLATTDDAGATLPATPLQDDRPAVRAFGIQAMSRAEPLRICASGISSVDPKLRAEFLGLIEEYARRVDAEARRIPEQDIQLGRLIDAADEMGNEFESKTDAWLESHPEVQEAVTLQKAELESVFRAIADDRGQLVAAASHAGLPDEKREAAKEVVDHAFIDFSNFAQKMQQRRVAAQRLPDNDPKKLDSAADLAEWEIHRLHVAKRVRDHLRELLPPDGRKQL